MVVDLARGRRLLAALLAVFLAGCGGSQSNSASTTELTESAVPTAAYAAGSYQAPEMLLSEFHESLCSESNGVKLDLSAVEQGYIAVSAVSEHRLKLQVLKDGETYTYDIASDGTPSIFPLQCGSGSYHIRVMENVVDSKYAQLYAEDCQVTLLDVFQPYLRPSDYVNYSPGSACVARAAQLAAGADTALDVVKAVYDYIVGSVTYDQAKAASVKSGYMPDPDETLRTGTGICFDYASLAAAMLRSQGIPAKVIFGYVSPNGLYHAWNMFYTEETGWVTVSYEVSAGWTRLDLTFSAGGASDTFVGDGENYSELYQY